MNVFSAVPVIPVRNLSAAMAFYVDLLGFTETFRLESYAGVQYGEAKLHLWADGSRKPPGSAEAYLICDEVDGYYQEITARGAVSLSEPHTYSYGMRDFNLEDPDGNHLTFGAEVKA
jgi:uncharacterized glyoxalase superfamily protein PhnB